MKFAPGISWSRPDAKGKKRGKKGLELDLPDYNTCYLLLHSKHAHYQPRYASSTPVRLAGLLCGLFVVSLFFLFFLSPPVVYLLSFSLFPSFTLSLRSSLSPFVNLSVSCFYYVCPLLACVVQLYYSKAQRDTPWLMEVECVAPQSDMTQARLPCSMRTLR